MDLNLSILEEVWNRALQEHRQKLTAEWPPWLKVLRPQRLFPHPLWQPGVNLSLPEENQPRYMTTSTPVEVPLEELLSQAERPPLLPLPLSPSPAPTALIGRDGRLAMKASMSDFALGWSGTPTS